MIWWAAVSGLVLGSMGAAALAESRVDCWWEEPSLFFTAKADGQVIAEKKSPPFVLDFSDKQAGDCSVLYAVPDGKEALTVGFTPGVCQTNWALGAQWELRLWLKAQIAEQPAAWPVILTDTAGGRAEGVLQGFAADGQWHQAISALKDLRAQEGFNYAGIASCRLGVSLRPGADDVRART